MGEIENTWFRLSESVDSVDGRSARYIFSQLFPAEYSQWFAQELDRLRSRLG